MAELRTDTGFWDELLDAHGQPRSAAAEPVKRLEALGIAELRERQDLAELDILAMGITFTVYSDGRGLDRAWPFDVIPRVIAASEWRTIERGLVQRLRVINLFIDDLYHAQHIVHDGVFPAALLTNSANFRPQCIGTSPRFGVWAHISGSDLVRDADGTMYVLEDNLRVPSGVSYVLENRAVSKRAFADRECRSSSIGSASTLPRSPGGRATSWCSRRASARSCPSAQRRPGRATQTSMRSCSPLGDRCPHTSLSVQAVSEVHVTEARVYPEGPVWEKVVDLARALCGPDAALVGAFAATTPLTPPLPGLAELTDEAFTPGSRSCPP